MQSLLANPLGLLHVGAAMSALIVGTLVLIWKKGTRTHRTIGYFYFWSMIITNVSALLIYRLFGTFGPFHYAAIFSFATVIAGIVPVFIKPKGWLRMHGTFMYFSVVGLYAAFFSEIFTRIPGSSFSLMVIVPSIAVTVIGWALFNRLKYHWSLVTRKR